MANEWVENEQRLEQVSKLAAGTMRVAAHKIELLERACEAALRWVENMRIEPGGQRDLLRRQLREALGKPPA